MPEETEDDSFPAESLHVAAKSGSVNAVTMLLRNKANPMDKDTDGVTAIEVAEAAGHTNVATLLREACGADEGFDESFEASPPTSPATVPQAEETGAAADTAAGAAPAPAAAEVPEDAPREEPAAPTADVVPEEPVMGDDSAAPEPDAQPSPTAPGGKLSGGPSLSKSALSIKSRLGNQGSACDCGEKGEMRTVKASALAGFTTGPKYTFTLRGNSGFIRTTSTPAPGSYNLPSQDKDKFKSVSSFSFGVSSRWGLETAPIKAQPGPGTYNSRNPRHEVQTKVGFGTAKRGKATPAHHTANPGPGAYEFKTCVGESKSYTARGRLATSYVRSRSSPGPGAYNPSESYTRNTGPKCGFGTSLRAEMATASGMPGPGSYELQQYSVIGKDSAKPSMTSRRRMHDLNSYTSPGPGSYNCVVTSFEGR